jgi:hypothetical protein
MNNNRISKQFHAMFGIFMVAFYIGFGIFFLFFTENLFVIDKAIRGIMGWTFLLFGCFRIYMTYKQITEAFFSKKDDDE